MSAQRFEQNGANASTDGLPQIGHGFATWAAMAGQPRASQLKWTG